MRRYLLLPLLFCACSKDPGRSGGSLGLGESAPIDNPMQTDVFIGQGQSNMVGKWDPQWLYPRVTFVSGEAKGPAVQFCNLYAAKYRARVLFIQCAVGGTSSNEWLPGGTLMHNCKNLYEPYLLDPKYKFKGILAYQGEKDAIQNYAVPWSFNFTTSMASFRSDLGPIPVIYAQIGQCGEFFKYWSYIQEEQSTLHLPKSQIITTKDLPIKDVVHLTTESYAEAGLRMFRAWNSLMSWQ